jgi:hypothetical protein
MVDNNKSKDEIITTSTRSAEAANFYDTVRQNCIRIVDELQKLNRNIHNRFLIYSLIGLPQQRTVSKVRFQLTGC